MNSALAFGQGLAAGMPGKVALMFFNTLLGQKGVCVFSRRMGIAFDLSEPVMIGDWQG